jgi:DNA-binding beta-propeller fold protein YncE
MVTAAFIHPSRAVKSPRLLRQCVILVSLLLAAGCGGARPLHQEQPVTGLQWPPSPDPARLVWVKSITGYRDLGIGKGFWQKVKDLVVGEDDRRIVRPHGVLYDNSDRLFVADPGSGVVHFMDQAGGRYVVIGGDARSPLRTPIGLTEDDRGGLYITDSSTGMVYRYDISRETLNPFLPRPLERPTGIVFNRLNRLLYIVETRGHRVIGVDLDGVERIRFGESGEGDGGFNHPTDIAVDGQGRLYVTDPLNYRIKVFTPEGRPVSQFGVPGDTAGALNKPKGVAVDSDGHIYVADALHDGVQLFDLSGAFLIAVGGPGSGNGQFWMPSGIAIDGHDQIFVADTYNQRIQVLRYLRQGGKDAGPGAAPSRETAR